MKYLNFVIVGLIFVTIFVVLFCTFFNRHKNKILNAQSIEKQMSKRDVLSIMGRPDSEKTEKDRNILTWNTCKKKLQKKEATYKSISVEFVNDLVENVIYVNF